MVLLEYYENIDNSNEGNCGTVSRPTTGGNIFFVTSSSGVKTSTNSTVLHRNRSNSIEAFTGFQNFKLVPNFFQTFKKLNRLEEMIRVIITNFIATLYKHFRNHPQIEFPWGTIDDAISYQQRHL